MRVAPLTNTFVLGIIHFRHPYELGGAYWSFNVISSIVAAFVVLTSVDMADEKKWQVKKETLLLVVTASSAMWLICYCCFMNLINPKYRRTFIDTRNAQQYSEDLFREVGASDEQKAKVATKYRGDWKHFEGDVKMFFLERWHTWVVEQPSWFTAGFRSSVPEDLIPEDYAEAVMSERGRRRSSVFGSGRIGGVSDGDGGDGTEVA